MHATSHAQALDHRGRLTEHYSCDQLLELATEKLPAAIVPEALYVRADGKLMLTLADEDNYYDDSSSSQTCDVVIVDPSGWTTKFSRFARGSWPGATIWTRSASFGWR